MLRLRLGVLGFERPRLCFIEGVSRQVFCAVAQLFPPSSNFFLMVARRARESSHLLKAFRTAQMVHLASPRNISPIIITRTGPILTTGSKTTDRNYPRIALPGNFSMAF